jgi:hypothetical protein
MTRTAPDGYIQEDDDHWTALNLALGCGVMAVLPTIYYDCSRYLPEHVNSDTHMMNAGQRACICWHSLHL